MPADDPFVARNEANWRSGVLVYVPRGQRLLEPLRLSVYQDEDGAGLDWRALIVLEEGAEAEVWERYVSDGDESEGLFNGVVELSVGPGANLRYVCEQELSERSWVFATQRAELERDASLEWVALGFGSARGKVRMETKLAGPGSSAKVTGAYAGAGAQHLDFDTTQEHAAEHTTSDLAFRGRALRPGDRRLARDDPRRSRRPADGRIPGVPQPAALQAGARRRDPGARDRGQRRSLHPRGGRGPGGPRAALLPALPRPAGAAGQALDHRRLPPGARRAHRRGPGCATPLSAALDRRLGEILPEA